MEVARRGTYAEAVTRSAIAQVGDAQVGDGLAGWSLAPVAAETTVRRFLARPLCCVVEVRSPRPTNDRASWEPRLIVFRDGGVRRVIDAIADTVRALPHHEVRIAGYEASTLGRVENPPPVVCVSHSAA
jgi:hypothetical protein